MVFILIRRNPHYSAVFTRVLRYKPTTLNLHLPPVPMSRSDVSLSITRIAVAQICQSVGYDAARASALDTLSDVAAHYLKAIAKSARDSANSCGRTHSNLFDIVIALEDLGCGQGGYPGASSSTIRNSIISSSLLKEIKKFVLYTDEIPFAQPLRRHGGDRNEKESYCFGVNLGHVPRWLPEMPVVERKEEVILRRKFGSQNMVVESEGKGNEERRWDRKGKGVELPEKRGKVRFEMGLKGKSHGVLSRVGTGKRVLCHNLSKTRNEVNENEMKKMKKKVVMRP